MTRHGAKFLAVMSRSGYNDEKSQKAAHDIRANGCEIELIQGDITSIDDVRKAFASRRVPIGGIIQGTMVIRVSDFDKASATTLMKVIFIGPNFSIHDGRRIPCST